MKNITKILFPLLALLITGCGGASNDEGNNNNPGGDIVNPDPDTPTPNPDPDPDPEPENPVEKTITINVADLGVRNHIQGGYKAGSNIIDGISLAWESAGHDNDEVVQFKQGIYNTEPIDNIVKIEATFNKTSSRNVDLEIGSLEKPGMDCKVATCASGELTLSYDKVNGAKYFQIFGSKAYYLQTLTITIGKVDENAKPDPTPDPGTNPDNPGGGEAGEVMLPMGFAAPARPDNFNNPVNIAGVDDKDYPTFEINSSLPEYFSEVTKSEKRSTTTKYYADGSYKLDYEKSGLQTCMFNSGWNHIEVRLNISTIGKKTTQDTKQQADDWLHVYGFDNNGNYIWHHYVMQGDFKRTTPYLKVNVDNAPNVSYLEFRLHSLAYDSQGCFSLGINSVVIKGWN